MLIHTENFTHRSVCTENFYTEKNYTEKFLRSFYIQKLLYADVFYTQKLWHRAVLTHRSSEKFWAEKFLSALLFTQRKTTQKFLHRQRSTHNHKLLHTDALTLRKLLDSCTRNLIHPNAFTQRSFKHPELHRETLPQSSFYTVQNCNFTSACDIRPWLRAQGLHLTSENRNFHPLPSGFDLRPWFCAKLTLFFAFDHHFARQGLHLKF